MRITPRMMFRFAMPKQGKPMVFPYTWTAKWSQWDVVFEFRRNYFFRFTCIGAAVVFPFIYYIDGMVNSPAAKAAHKKAVLANKEKEHEAHMWADISGRYAKRGL